MVAPGAPPRTGARALNEAVIYGVLVVAGVLAGFLNTVAGGGSLLTVPALMLLGMPAPIANGTNRLAVVSQSLAGAVAFRRAGKLPTEGVVATAAPSLLGAILGATLASIAPEWLLKPVLLGTMSLMALVVLFKPDLTRGSADEPPARLRERPLAVLGLFFAGVYGGFAQAGVGLVLLAVLAGMLRYDVARANGLKLAVVLVYGVVVLGIFVVAGQVDWIPAIVLAASTVVGSQLGVRFALKADPRWIRGLLFVAVVAVSAGAMLRR